MTNQHPVSDPATASPPTIDFSSFDFLSPLLFIFPLPKFFEKPPSFNPSKSLHHVCRGGMYFLLQIRDPPMAVLRISVPAPHAAPLFFFFSRARGHLGLLTPPYWQFLERLLT